MKKSQSKFLALAIKKVTKLNSRLKVLEDKLEETNMLSISETVKKYGISRSTIDRYRKKGLKVGQPTRNGQIFIDEAELQNFLKNVKSGR